MIDWFDWEEHYNLDIRGGGNGRRMRMDYSSDHLIFERNPPPLSHLPLAYSARPAFAQPAP